MLRGVVDCKRGDVEETSKGMTWLTWWRIIFDRQRWYNSTMSSHKHAFSVRACLWTDCIVRHARCGVYSVYMFRTMSCWYKVIACFMSVDFFTCRSYRFSRTCSSKSLPRADNVSSQAWLNILRTSLHNPTSSKSLKSIVCPRALLMLKNQNTWIFMCLPINIERLLCWVAPKKLIFPLKSAGIIFLIPVAISESRVSNLNGCLWIWIVKSPSRP